jgi:trigger factor
MEAMSDSKKKRLIGVIAAITVIIVTVTGCNSSNEDTNDPTGNDNITTTVTPTIEDSNPTESVTPQITDEPVTPTDVMQPVESEPAKATLGAYKGIKAAYSPKEITDEDIDVELEKLQKENSFFKNLPDRAFKESDMAIVSINTFAEGKFLQDSSVRYIQVVLGSEDLPDFMAEEIYGKKIGEFVQVYHDYPEDFEDPEMAGKNVLYDIELVDGFEYYVPDITDSFIKENTGYASLTEYKTKTKEKLQEDENSRAYDEMVDKLKQNLIDNCSYSGDMDYEIKKAYVLKTQKYNAEAEEYGYPDAATMYMYEYYMSAEEYQNMVKSEAEFEVKYQLALDEIVTTEKLSDSYPEYSQAELRNAAEQLVIDSADIDGSLN